MKPLALRRTLVERAYDAIVDGICDGTIPTSTHLVQEQLAERLGVSRQPIQQALLLLKNDGVLEDAGRCGLIVPPLDPASTRHRYEIRAALDVLAARLAAERCAAEPRVAAVLRQEGAIRLTEGRTAIREGTVSLMIARDVAFHRFLYRASGNPFLGAAADQHWPFLRRVMAEVLRRAAQPPEVWEQHRGILDAVVAGNAATAAALAEHHVRSAAERLLAALAADAAVSTPLAAALG